MASPWDTVISSPEFAAMSPEEKQTTRDVFFDQVIAPREKDPEVLGYAREMFNKQNDFMPKPQPEQDPGAMAAFLKSAKHEAGSGILGGIGAALGAAGAGALAGAEAGSIVPGWGTLAGGIAGALAGGFLGKKTQQAIQGQEAYEKEAQELAKLGEQHPIATSTGALLPILPTMMLAPGAGAVTKIAGIGDEIANVAAAKIAQANPLFTGEAIESAVKVLRTMKPQQALEYAKTLGVGDEAAQLIQNAATSTGQRIASQALESGAQMGIMSAGESAAQVAEGNKSWSDVPGDVLKGTITGAPLGLMGPVSLGKGRFGAALGGALAKGPVDAALMATGEEAYDAATGRSEGFSFQRAGERALGMLPSFSLLAGGMGVFHGAPEFKKPTETEKVQDPFTNLPEVSAPEAIPEHEAIQNYLRARESGNPDELLSATEQLAKAREAEIPQPTPLEKAAIQTEDAGSSPILTEALDGLNQRIEDQKNAIQERSAEEVFSREPEEAGVAGGERERVGSIEQGLAPTEEANGELRQEKIDLTEGVQRNRNILQEAANKLKGLQKAPEIPSVFPETIPAPSEGQVREEPGEQFPETQREDRPAAVEEKLTPEVAESTRQITRDTSKPEQMTPDEFTPVGNSVDHGIFKSKKQAADRLTELEDTISKSPRMIGILSEFNLTPRDAYEVAKDRHGRWSIGATHKHRIALAVRERQPVSSDAVDAYGIKLPEGYAKQGDLYIYKPEVATKLSSAGSEQLEEITPNPLIQKLDSEIDRASKLEPTKPNRAYLQNISSPEVREAIGKFASSGDENDLASLKPGTRNQVIKWASESGMETFRERAEQIRREQEKRATIKSADRNSLRSIAKEVAKIDKPVKVKPEKEAESKPSEKGSVTFTDKDVDKLAGQLAKDLASDELPEDYEPLRPSIAGGEEKIPAEAKASNDLIAARGNLEEAQKAFNEAHQPIPIAEATPERIDSILAARAETAKNLREAKERLKYEAVKDLTKHLPWEQRTKEMEGIADVDTLEEHKQAVKDAAAQRKPVSAEAAKEYGIKLDPDYEVDRFGIARPSLDKRIQPFKEYSARGARTDEKVSAEQVKAAVKMLPKAVRKILKKSGFNVITREEASKMDGVTPEFAAKAEGFYHDGKIYVIPENIVVTTADANALKAAARVLVHENLHEAFDAVITKDPKAMEEWKGLLKQIPENDLEALARDYQKGDDWRRDPKAATDLAEEWLAKKWEDYQAGKMAEAERPIFERILNSIRKIIERVFGGVRQFKTQDEDLEAFFDKLSQNRLRVKSGEGESKASLPADEAAEKERLEKIPVTPEMNAKYMEAVKNGDMETAQRMVDEAAKKAFPQSLAIEPITSSKDRLENKPLLKLYHGTNADFNIFERGRIGVTDFGWLGVMDTQRHGIFFAENKDFAKTFAKSKNGNRVIEAFLNVRNPFSLQDAQDIVEGRNIGDEFSADFNMANWFRKLTDQWDAFDGEQGKDFVSWLESKGYDGAIIQEVGIGLEGEPAQDVWVALSPNQIKSADPVTHDNQGNPIPLSERFNPESPDIRFSIPTSEEAERERQFGKNLFGLSMEALEKQAAELDLPPLERAKLDLPSGLFEKIKQDMLTDKDMGKRAVDRILSGEGGLATQNEEIAMALENARLAKQLTTLDDRLSEPGISRLDSESILNQIDDIKTQMNRTMQALYESGTKLSRAFYARQLAFNNKYELQSIYQRARRAKGGRELTKEENEHIFNQAQRILKDTEAFDKLEREKDKLRIPDLIDLIAKQVEQIKASGGKIGDEGEAVKRETPPTPGLKGFDLAYESLAEIQRKSVDELDSLFSRINAVKEAIKNRGVKRDGEIKASLATDDFANLSDAELLKLEDELTSQLEKAINKTKSTLGLETKSKEPKTILDEARAKIAQLQAEPKPKRERTPLEKLIEEHRNSRMSVDEFVKRGMELGLDEPSASTLYREFNIKHGGYIDELPDSVYGRLLRKFVEEGERDTNEIAKKISKWLGDNGYGEISPEDVMERVSGYGKKVFPSQEEVAKISRQKRAEMLVLSQIRDIEENLKAPELTGAQRDKAHAELRELMKKRNDMMRDLGIQRQSPEAQFANARDRAIRSLENRREELMRILSGEQEYRRRENKTRLKDAEEHALFDEVRKLSDQVHDLYDKDEPITAEKWNAEKERRLTKTIEALQKRIKEGDFLPKGKLEFERTEAVKGLEDTLESLREDFEQMKDAAHPELKIEAKQKAITKALNDRINDLNKIIENGRDLREKSDVPETPEMKGARETIKELNEKLKIKEWPERRLESLRKSLDRADKAINDNLPPEAKKKYEDLKTLEIKQAEEDLKDKRYTRLLQAQERKWNEKLEKGDFAPKKREERALNDKQKEIKARIEETKEKIDKTIKELEWSQLTPLEKAGEWAVRLKRFAILSSPVSVFKLSSAAMTRAGTMSMENFMPTPLELLYPEYAKLGVLENRGTFKQLADSIAEGWTIGMKDAAETLKKGQSELDRLYGKGSLEKEGWTNFFGRMHGMLKAPVKRAAFKLAMSKQIQAFEIEKGRPPSIDEQVPMGVRAYEWANRQIFMNDNAVTSAWNAGLNTLEQKDMKWAANLGRFLLPIVKVPTNIAIETMQYTPAGLAKGAYDMMKVVRAGLDEIKDKPQLVESIQRNFRKGAIGSGLMLLGYALPQIAGGFYERGEKRHEDEPDFGEMMVGGVKIPKWMLHAPFFEVIQLGSTMRRAVDHSLEKHGERDYTEGAIAGLKGVADELPFISEMGRISDAFDNQKSRNRFLGDMVASSVVPAAVGYIARKSDTEAPESASLLEKLNAPTIKRETVADTFPKTALQSIKAQIPGLREQLLPRVDNPFGPGVKVPKQLQEYEKSGHPMPSVSTRADFEKGYGKVSDARWLSYVSNRGRGIRQAMAEKYPDLMQMSEEDKRRAIQQITKHASSEARKAIGLSA